MKKYFSLLLLLSIFCSVSAQQISVKSFRKLEMDLDAKVNEPLKDQNGDLCAIIKVQTTQSGFYFDGGQLGIKKTELKHGEIWLYVPWGLKRLTISHDKLGVLRDYQLNIPIEKASVYEMVLTTGKVITTVEETIDSQWLVINPEPADASVYLNDLFVKSGTYQTKLKPGSYSYRVEAPLYHTEAGKVEINDTKKEIIARLKPAFGYVTVNTEPEKEAKVIIDGKALTTNTPCKSEALASGTHTVQVIKEMYQPATQKVTITDGQTAPVNFKLQPNFAELNITTSAEATLYINNEQKAKANWNGRLNPGVYSLEARLDKYRPAKQDIELSAADVRTVNLLPSPIYGSLDIITTPVGASILINGKDYGTTPNTIKNLLIGEYTIQLSKIGFASVNKTVTVIDGKSIDFNEVLFNSGNLKINSNPSDADIFIDEKLIGKTPLNAELSFGKHRIKVTYEDKTNLQEIDFSAESSSELSVELYECNKYKLITSSPNYATIFINGEEKGSTPLNYRMLNAEESITIKKDGYKTYRDKIYCQDKGFNAYLTERKDILEPLKRIYWDDFLSLGIPTKIGLNNTEFIVGSGIGLNVKLFDWLFVRNDFNAEYLMNYGFNFSGIHSICLGFLVDQEKNLIFGEYGIGYNSNYYGMQTNLFGIGYGDYKYNLSLRLVNSSIVELNLRFGLFSKSNDNYWNGVRTIISLLTLGMVH